MTAAGFVALLPWLHRSDAPREPREKLIARGVQVCTKCGYLLRGLPSSIGRCLGGWGLAFDAPTAMVRSTSRISESSGHLV